MFEGIICNNYWFSYYVFCNRDFLQEFYLGYYDIHFYLFFVIVVKIKKSIQQRGNGLLIKDDLHLLRFLTLQYEVKN